MLVVDDVATTGATLAAAARALRAAGAGEVHGATAAVAPEAAAGALASERLRATGRPGSTPELGAVA